MVSKHVFYSGRVQGVGFRYATQRLADAFAVTGFVRNLPNGDVELVAEGEPAAVQAFLAAIGKRMGHYITSSRIADETPSGYPDFGIRY